MVSAAKMQRGHTLRHSHANDIIKRALASCGVPSVLEPPGLSRSDGKRPDGTLVWPRIWEAMKQRPDFMK